MISSLVLVGGTHGNELTGVYLHRQWQDAPESIARPGLQVRTLLANPPAVAQCRRYVDTDLNRCFRLENLTGPLAPGIEPALARQIHENFGPKGSPSAPDLVIDYHNSTAAMGISLIVGTDDPYMRRLCAWTASRHPLVRIYAMLENAGQSPYLPSVGKRDLCVEVGPQVHGTLNAELLRATDALTQDILDFTVAWNNDSADRNPIEVPIYAHWRNLDFPRRPDGSLAAMVHPSLLGADYRELRPGQPLFQDFDGNDLPWVGEHSVWPVFISESAYYEKGIAMSLTRLQRVLW